MRFNNALDDGFLRRHLHSPLHVLDGIVGVKDAFFIYAVAAGYALKAGQLTYDCRYSTMHGMPVTGGRGFRGLKPLWYNGVPP